MINLFCLFICVLFVGCGYDCVDKKTGMHKSSETIEESVHNKVFRFEMDCPKKTFSLDSGVVLSIKNAWVENSWAYDCVHNSPVVKKDSALQFVIDAYFNGNKSKLDYFLMLSDKSMGAYPGGILNFNYYNQDTLSLFLMKEQRVLSKIIFFRKNIP
jgi:hypothetical protein